MKYRERMKLGVGSSVILWKADKLLDSPFHICRGTRESWYPSQTSSQQPPHRRRRCCKLYKPNRSHKDANFDNGHLTTILGGIERLEQQEQRFLQTCQFKIRAIVNEDAYPDRVVSSVR